jgi:ABC-type lipoprotein export system ATPase subunit
VSDPLLRLDSVRRSYWRGPHEDRVLRGVSLELHAGELVGIYGPRGSGKTTLLRIAAGFEAPDEGTVTFEGRDLAQLSRRERSHLLGEDVGWVERDGPQARELPMRVYAGLPVYRRRGPAEAQRRAAAALGKVGVDDVLDSRWAMLSNTERILVAIAHAIVREPKVLIIDDPTAGLDLIDRERVVGLLRAAAEEDGLGVLMAVPDMPAMLQAHHVRSLSRGKLLQPTDPPPDNHGKVIEFPSGERSA